jgi:internalin A
MPDDKWLGHFEAFKKLEFIQLDWCGENITGKGLRHISGLKRLKALNLWTCAVRDSVLVHLLPVKSLEWLRLCETRITDKGLKTLAQLPRLRGLELFSTTITDKGLVHLQRCRRLEYLDLNGTEVTEAGVKELALHLPSCNIQAAALS